MSDNEKVRSKETVNLCPGSGGEGRMILSVGDDYRTGCDYCRLESGSGGRVPDHRPRD